MSSRIARSIALAVVVVTAACAPAADGGTALGESTAVVAAVAAESATAAAVAALPPSALWDADRVVERLVRAGVAPRRDSAATRVAFLPVAGTAVAVGGDAVVHAFVFADSATRARATAGLDTLTGAPPGATPPWTSPVQVVVSNNLFAVVVGGSDRQRERVWLALGAGLAAP